MGLKNIKYLNTKCNYELTNFYSSKFLVQISSYKISTLLHVSSKNNMNVQKDERWKTLCYSIVLCFKNKYKDVLHCIKYFFNQSEGIETDFSERLANLKSNFIT